MVIVVSALICLEVIQLLPIKENLTTVAIDNIKKKIQKNDQDGQW